MSPELWASGEVRRGASLEAVGEGEAGVRASSYRHDLVLPLFVVEVTFAGSEGFGVHVSFDDL